MNKYEKEVIQAQLNNEKEVLKNLKMNYARALNDINDKIANLMGRDDADMSHVIYQVEYQKNLKLQIQTVLELLQSNNFETVSQYLTQAYEDGFIGAMYNLQHQGIPMIIPINQKDIVTAIQTESKLSTNLYAAFDMKKLNSQISGEISRGLSTGLMYSDIARNVSGYAGISRNSAMRIARTEGHRIQTKASMDACKKAESKGADIVKQWDASLDDKTRDSHRLVNREIRELDEPFSNGLMYPSDPSGDASEVINCRCALLQRARSALGGEYSKWSPDEPEMISDDGTTQFAYLTDDKSYKAFKEHYKQASDKMNEK